MSAWTLHCLPTNGLDRSLHAPVLVGLVFVSLFTECFGWTYAGLVVPGYLAATFAAAPITAVLVLFEGWLTHLGVACIARIIPEKTGAWSTAFGRERFFLYIVIAVVIRLFIEGTVVPWATIRYGLVHSRELYSVGLVLVPLIANVFWSSGVLHAGPRLVALTGLTYLVVDWFLLRHTNFSLSRFQVANESVALHFLDTPKAYLLLLVGAMLGARGNVQYGWDYNGILVPALLAVAWYEPLKLLGTGAEAIALYLLARFLSDVRPFSRIALVGPRRMLFVGILGFAVKLAIGHGLWRVAPRVQLTEYLGFGYILPSLLAVKMWNKLRIGIVIMPTLQVSLTAFLLGNALGFGLNWLTNQQQRLADPPHWVSSNSALAFTWLVASNQPPTRPGECEDRPVVESALEIIERLLKLGSPDRKTLELLQASALEAVSDQQGWWLIVPKSLPVARCSTLRVAIAPRFARPKDNIALLVNVESYGSALSVAALSMADAASAPIILLRLSGDPPGAPTPYLAERLAEQYSVIEVSADARSGSQLDVAGAVPVGLNMAAIERLSNAPIGLNFVAPDRAQYPRLHVAPATAEAIACSILGPSNLEQWPDALRRSAQLRAEELVGQSYQTPTRSELLLLSSVVLPALESSTRPSAWVMSMARHLGYRIAQSTEATRPAWILYESASMARRGNATWFVRPEAKRALTIEVPAPLWELGSLSYGLALFDATDARHLLIAGVRPDAKADGSSDPRRATGRVSYYQHLHEATLARGDDVLAIHAVRPDVALESDVTLEATAPILRAAQRSALATETAELLAQGGLSVQYYSASVQQISIGAQSDPAFSFAERFAPHQMLRLWLTQGARERITRIPPQLAPLRQIVDRSASETDVAELVKNRLIAPHAQRPIGPISNACNLDAVTQAIEQWLKDNNPYDRLDARRIGTSCEWRASVDTSTGTPWLVLIGSGQARIIPLHHHRAATSHTVVDHQLDRLRQAVDLGTATIIVEAP